MAAPSYPATRPGRIGGAATTGGPSVLDVPVPVARLLPFLLRENGEQAVGTSATLQGPGILDEITFYISSAGGAPDPTIRVLVSAPPGQPTGNLPLATVVQGTTVFEPVARSDNSGATQRHAQAVPLQNQVLASGLYRFRIARYVTLPEWVVTVVVTAEIGFDVSCAGFVRVIESVPPERAPNFL